MVDRSVQVHPTFHLNIERPWSDPTTFPPKKVQVIQPLALDFLDGRLNPTDAGIKIKIKIESKNIYSTGIKKINKKVIKKK